MADHFVGLNRGQDGLSAVQFATGAATQGTDVELRVADGQNLTRKDVDLILEALERFFQNSQQVVAAGFVLP